MGNEPIGIVPLRLVYGIIFVSLLFTILPIPCFEDLGSKAVAHIISFYVGSRIICVALKDAFLNLNARPGLLLRPFYFCGWHHNLVIWPTRHCFGFFFVVVFSTIF